MSGVAKDDINPTEPSEDTASVIGDAETARPEQLDPGADAEARAQRRVAPHLRVVADNEDAEFTAPVVPVEPPNQRIGQLIRTTRENLGYSLDQVSKETRVHLSHLRAIEDMTPNLLGAPVYAKGYIKTYARHLGLDEQTTLERYLRECAILKDPEKQTIAPPATGRKLPTAIPVFGFLIVALIAGAGVFFFASGDRTPQTDIASTPSAAEPSPISTIGVIADAGAATAPITQQLRLVAVKRELIEVRSAAGDKYVHRYFEPGEGYTVRVGSGWTVSTEDGSAFEWRLGEDSLGLLAPQGPVYSQSVDLAAQRPPIVVEAPPEPDATVVEPAPADATADTTPAIVAAPPRASNTTPAPARPRSTRPRPEAATSATPPATQPRVAAAPPVVDEPTTRPPVTTPQDPALLAYPGLPPAQPEQ
jgi:hypothetical protein